MTISELLSCLVKSEFRARKCVFPLAKIKDHSQLWRQTGDKIGIKISWRRKVLHTLKPLPQVIDFVSTWRRSLGWVVMLCSYRRSPLFRVVVLLCWCRQIARFVILGTFRSEYEYDYEYEFSALARTLGFKVNILQSARAQNGKLVLRSKVPYYVLCVVELHVSSHCVLRVVEFTV